MIGFILGNPTVWSAGSMNIMQVEFHPLRMTGLGHCSDFKTLKQEVRRVGLNGNSNSHEVGDCVGSKNEATLRRVGSTGWKRPSEGAKRRYPAHFLSKLTDADGELQETLHWLKTAKACEYVSAADRERLLLQLQQIGRLLGSMINRYESFCY